MRRKRNIEATDESDKKKDRVDAVNANDEEMASYFDELRERHTEICEDIHDAYSSLTKWKTEGRYDELRLRGCLDSDDWLIGLWNRCGICEIVNRQTTHSRVECTICPLNSPYNGEKCATCFTEIDEDTLMSRMMIAFDDENRGIYEVIRTIVVAHIQQIYDGYVASEKFVAEILAEAS